MRSIKHMSKLLSLTLISVLSIVTTACENSQVSSNSDAQKPAVKSTSKVIVTSEVEWEPLNPARGDKSPKAGTLWGDRKGSVPTGFLVKFVDGFVSPPHIHNVSYRGVVIQGLIHNDDPGAADMWMPTSSFWTQPKGEVHITAAKGITNMAYIEIEEGPYLVLPSKEAFDSGERPINVDVSNIVWIEQPGMSASTNGPKIAFLWGNTQDGQLNGTLVKLSAGFTGKILSSSTFRAVVIKGQPKYQVSETDVKTLEPGSYFSSKGESEHQISSIAGKEIIIYVRTDGKYEVIPALPNRR